MNAFMGQIFKNKPQNWASSWLGRNFKLKSHQVRTYYVHLSVRVKLTYFLEVLDTIAARKCPSFPSPWYFLQRIAETEIQWTKQCGAVPRIILVIICLRFTVHIISQVWKGWNRSKPFFVPQPRRPGPDIFAVEKIANWFRLVHTF